MKFFLLRPEVPGRVGADTELDTSIHPPEVTGEVAYLELDDWLGSSVIKCFPCFFATKELAEKIRASDLSGCMFRPSIVRKLPTFNDLYPAGRYLPEFEELVLTGEAGKHDFGRSSENKLVVSERTLEIIKDLGPNQCDIEDFRT